MQAWWAEEASLKKFKNIKNLTVRNILTGSVGDNFLNE